MPACFDRVCPLLARDNTACYGPLLFECESWHVLPEQVCTSTARAASCGPGAFGHSSEQPRGRVRAVRGRGAARRPGRRH